jgi:DNA-binding protein HU-beta
MVPLTIFRIGRELPSPVLTQELSLTGWQAWEPHNPVSGECMNKADLVDRIAGACSISKAQATTAIDTAVDSITASLKKGDRVALIGFGTFSVSQRKARNGRNPQTGATIKIAARRVAKFTPGNELRKVVNKGK